MNEIIEALEAMETINPHEIRLIENFKEHMATLSRVTPEPTKWSIRIYSTHYVFNEIHIVWAGICQINIHREGFCTVYDGSNSFLFRLEDVLTYKPFTDLFKNAALTQNRNKN